MRVVLAVVGGVLLLCVALVALAPATLIDGQIAGATAGRVRLSETEGTLWSGRGNLVLPGDFQQPVSWQIDRASSAIAGELRGTLRVASANASGAAVRAVPFEIGPDRVHIEGLTLTVPADALVRASGAALPFVASGTVSVQLDRLDIV